jgi:hypothetical protein
MGATFQTLPDAAVLAAGKDDAGEITFVAETDLAGITGIRLEVLADAGLPRQGPRPRPQRQLRPQRAEGHGGVQGRPEDGQAVMLVKPLADFSQGDFDIKNAVDGSPNGGKGWAVAPATGVGHWATFETGEAVGFEGGTVLTVKLAHRYVGKQHMPGKFRIAVTRVPRPIGLDLSEELRAIVATAPEVRTGAQQDALLAYHRAVDPELRTKIDAVAQSQAPLPVDPKLKELRDGLELARRPIPLDPKLAQLRQDVAMSLQQAASRRLTAAQDVAWALINSPSFLFNH